MDKQIGWYTINEDTVFTNSDFETAAWVERIACKAGKYPVYVYDYRINDDGKVSGHIGMGHVGIPGAIVSDYFGSLFFGVPIGSYDETQNAGKPATYRTQQYLYAIADEILHNPDTKWSLLEGYEAREIRFTYDGTPHTTHGIFARQ